MATKMEEKLAQYDRASTALHGAVRDHKGIDVSVPMFGTAEQKQKATLLATLQFARAIGDLTVTGIDEFSNAVTRYVETSEADRRSAGRIQNIVLGLGLFFAAIAAVGTAVQAYAAVHPQSVGAPSP